MKLEIDHKCVEYKEGTRFEAIAADFQHNYPDRIALVIYNGKIRELFKKANRDGTLSFLTLSSAAGHMAYHRTACMMMLKAVRDVACSETVDVKVEFTVGYGFYCTFRNTDRMPEASFLEKIEKRMEELRDQKIPIRKRDTPMEEALQIFEKQGMLDKVQLFRYRASSSVNVYNLDGFYDYYYGYMLPDTSYVTKFHLQRQHDGFLLVLPPQEKPDVLVKTSSREKVFNQMILSTHWGRMMQVQNVADLNDCVVSGKVNQLILVQEALFERRIGEIAKHIYDRPHVKMVMIAGPSSSGKTSFANRLCIQLRTFGRTPHLISLDNYYKNREDTPKNPDGSYNFETIDAIDVEYFNESMKTLLAGGTVEIPRFNFVKGEREKFGEKLKIGESDILVFEGIHGLNEEMSYALPSESKYKIYISCLTTLNIDSHNRISTTDARILRRIVRDARTRGSSAAETIGMWKSIRAGEEAYIFPFQEEADEMFNSAAIYEFAVLKQYAVPLLYQIQQDAPERLEANRLLKFLGYFLAVDSQILPNNSICREFVGGSIFHV